MNYKVLSCSFLVAIAAACTTGPANEDDLTGNERPTLEEFERGPDLIGPAPIEPGPVEPSLIESDLTEQEQTEAANKPIESDALIIVSPREHVTGPTMGDIQGTVQTHRLPNSKASMSLRREGFRRAREPLYREQYEHPGDHRVTRVTDTPVSTFSIDVDTGAYSNMRRWLNQGHLPPQDAVRIEEFINYFDYKYPSPKNRQHPFLVETEIAPTPWNQSTHLLRIGIQGYEVPEHELPCSNLVFLIDVSGSMRSADKLPLLKQSLGMLARKLNARDHISLVVYAGASGVVLPPTSGRDRSRILNAISQLEAGGSTNGAAGIRLAYQMAQQNFQPEGVNRVILATDGDFNVGMSSTTELIDMIQRQREAGIALTTLGFGSGNYNDHMLEQLADEGNGNHAYIDKLSEAKKVLSDELTSTLMTIASDVKIQVEFNPESVSEYRLIGYENRILNEEDFNNDKIDAGEIGAGHRVTALYEISLARSGYRRIPDRRYGYHGESDSRRESEHSLANELAHLRIRYKQPGQNRSQLIQAPILRSTVLSATDRASNNFRFAAAVAAFGQKLRGGQYLESLGYPEIAELARNARGQDPFGYRSEFVQLISLAEMLDDADGFANHGYQHEDYSH